MEVEQKKRSNSNPRNSPHFFDSKPYLTALAEGGQDLDTPPSAVKK